MDDSVNMFKYMIVKLLQCVLVTYYEIKHYFSGLFSDRVPDNIRIEKEYQNQNILLFAMYEPGVLRPDVKRFLQAAKRAGLYVLGVNTAVITENIDDLFDCYIERENIGRDFGSYKTGFEYLFSKHYLNQCSRLLMMNDSVFYESSRVGKFLDQMIHTDMEVLGATENFEVYHHLGSFCISLAGNVLRSDRFKDFWKHYQNSDIRVVVIEKGEAALSACLRQCVSLPEKLGALYNLLYVDKQLETHADEIDTALRLARRGIYPGWPNLAQDCISTQCRIYVIGQILDAFRVGSQIHNSNAYLMHLGLPLVKLDGIYRGMFVKEDVAILGSLMSPEESKELDNLLMKKSFWQDQVKDIRKWLYLLGIK